MAEEARPMDIAGRKLMIAIPAYDGKLNIKTSFALTDLVVKASHFGVQVQLSHLSGCSLITKARNVLVANFLESDCTDMLFVDADIVVDADSVLRLLALSTGKDITAGMYTRRAEDRKFFLDIYIDQNNTLEFDDHGMLRVENVATGFMMIQRHVIEKMIQNHPEWRYFNDFYNRDEYCLFDFELSNGQYIGEDYTFCKRARADGFTVFVDPEITLPHVGSQEYHRSFKEDVLMPLIQQHCTPKLKVANG
jgi:hypothetical protein